MQTDEFKGNKIAAEHVANASSAYGKSEVAANASNGETLDASLFLRACRKVDIRLMPCVCWLVIVAYLDRTAIGNANIEGMTEDLNMSGTQYSIALFIFFIPYILFDVPANMLMKRVRPSYWLCGLMFAWSLVTIGEGVTASYAGLVVCRLILGICETGFFPGCIYLMACYYPRRMLLKRLSAFYAASILANAFGGLLAYAIDHMDGVCGYAGWRWIFILEGILTAVTAVILVWFVPDWPEQSKFLNADEKTALLAGLAEDESDLIEEGPTRTLLKRTFTDPKVWLATLIYFAASMAANSSGFFLPTILYELGWTNLKAQYLSIPVYLVAATVAMVNGALSDHFRHRYGFTMFPLALLMIGYSIFLAQSTVTVGVCYMAAFFMVSGAFATITIALAWLSNNVPGRKRKGMSLAVQLGVGNCGGILGANIFLESQAPTYPLGYGICLGVVLLAMASASILFLYLWRENQAKRAGRRDGSVNDLLVTEQTRLGEKHPAFKYMY